MTHAGPRRVILAPDKFKGSLTAAEVAAALARGIVRAAPGTEVRQLPVADGGDGTVDAFLAADWERVPVQALGPTGRKIDTAYARRGDTAVIELAAVVGVVKLPGGVLDPLGASTYGLGLVIADALDRGVRDIVLGLGGSASTDGGAGMLHALGLRIRDASGVELSWPEIVLGHGERVDRTGLHPALTHTRITLASDVDNPLLGPTGAAAVYAPQKGAGPAEITTLEAALSIWAQLIGPEWAGKPGAGAAGGTGFGAMAVLGAVPRSGIDVVLDLVDFPAHLTGADLIVTGEGSLDLQSLHGKAPTGVATVARRAGIPVVAVSGRLQLTPDQLHAAGFAAAYALTDLEPDPLRCMADAAALVERTGERLAAEHL
ncbi:glycerate kinase [Nocardia sp. NBC_01388]|uniref:glycerate kinase n=1 Tax=Nocardia sp. NBC_01388 TaxID=2903596 RepID=UPI003247FE23